MNERPDERLTAAKDENATTFEMVAELPLGGEHEFIPNEKDSQLDEGITPLNVTDCPVSPEGRAELIAGAAFLGFSEDELLPHQFLMADVMAAGYTLNGVAIPRRGFKTTTVWAIAVGRALNPDRKPKRGGYEIVLTAQTGIAARTRFLDDLVAPIEARYDLDDPSCPVKVNRGRASEALVFRETGARIRVLPPIPSSWRGASVDFAIFDEGQEFEPDKTALLRAAVLPTMGTRPGAQLLVEGTALEPFGFLWETLQSGRAGSAGILEYGADPHTPDFDPEVDEDVTGTTSDPEVWKAAHPGIPVTPLSFIAMQHDIMPLDTFKNEYLGMWSSGLHDRFFNPETWKACETGPVPAVSDLPANWQVSFAVHPENYWAAAVLGWRDEEGRGHVMVLDARKGVDWLAPFLIEFARKYKRKTIWVNRKLESNRAVFEELAKATPRVKVEYVQGQDVQTSHVVLYRDFTRRSLRHYNQPDMNRAAENVTKKTYSDGRWWFFRNSFGDDITAIEAGALALFQADRAPKPRTLPKMTLQN